jgi:dihydrofolate synthase / folylpolyglutamate synthase
MTDHLRASDAALERLKTLHPKKIDLSLERIARVLDALGRPQDKLPPVIHVAGTNGKGSTVAFLRAIAEAAGLKAHVYTSPHLVRFVERIRVAGELISDARLAEVLARVERANAGQGITFFEITAAAALLAFAETPADVCVLEVGLGGRFDATNVIPDCRVAAIAPVDYDHAEFLGTDLGRIAWEKAGIIKPKRPVVSARQAEVSQVSIEAEAERMNAPLQLMSRDFDAFSQGGRMVFQGQDRLLDLPPPSLYGPHQVENAGLAIAAALAFGGPMAEEAAIARGIAGAVWPARMQRLSRGPYGERAAARGADLWLDGTHNPHGARALAQALEALVSRDGRPLALVTGILGNKDAAGMFEALKGLKPRVFTVPSPSEAGAAPEDLAAAARAVGLRAEARDSVMAGFEAALALEGPAPHVVICGSLYLAGEVLAASPETWPR